MFYQKKAQFNKITGLQHEAHERAEQNHVQMEGEPGGADIQHQGNEDMYSYENLVTREALRGHPEIRILTQKVKASRVTISGSAIP